MRFNASNFHYTLSFRNSSGFYVPSTIFYTLLAQKTDKSSWTVVNELYRKPLPPSSIVDLVLSKEDLSVISGHNLERKVVIDWSFYVEGQGVIESTEHIDFTINEPPVILPEPGPSPEPILTPFNVLGTSVSTPAATTITFLTRFSCPVLRSSLINSIFLFVGVELVVPTEYFLDPTGTLLTVTFVTDSLGTYRLTGTISSVSNQLLGVDYVYTVPGWVPTP